MSHSVEVVTPIPSAETVAERLGMSNARRKLIFDLADGLDVRATRKPATVPRRESKKMPQGLRAKTAR